MKKQNNELDRVDISDFLTDAAADIDTCSRSLSLLAEHIDNLPNEHSLILLVSGKLDQLIIRINKIDERYFREQH